MTLVTLRTGIPIRRYFAPSGVRRTISPVRISAVHKQPSASTV
jgi:hypothetical protein